MVDFNLSAHIIIDIRMPRNIDATDRLKSVSGLAKGDEYYHIRERILHVSRHSNRLHQPGQKSRATRYIFDDDMFVFGMRASSVNAESIEDGRPHCGDEISVGTSADDIVFEIES